MHSPPVYIFYANTVPPKVIAAQANIVQVINSNVVIQFSIMDAAPPVQVEGIYWNFTTSGMTRPVTNTTTISLSFDRLTLTINNAQPSHIGSYMITVSNPAGSSTGSVQLSILGKWHTKLTVNFKKSLFLSGSYYSSSTIAVCQWQ